MLTVRYFASVRESLERESERLPLPPSVSTVAEMMAWLGAENPAFRSLDDAGGRLLVAVNHTVVGRAHPLRDGDEIAFFPPMTGG